MPEVTVIARFQAKPGRENGLQQALRAAVRGTHGEEGCRLYALHRSAEDPLDFLLVERWVSREALDIHFTTPHFKALGSLLPDLVAVPADVKIYLSLPEGEIGKGIL